MHCFKCSNTLQKIEGYQKKKERKDSIINIIPHPPNHSLIFISSLLQKMQALETKHFSSFQRGAFILFEGLDRSGKSTQAKLLVEYLKTLSIKVKLIRFPNRESATGKMINDYLKCTAKLDPHAIHLTFSANRWDEAKGINNDIDGGTWIVMDRYAYSGVAYSVAKGLPLEWCKQADSGLPAPDITFFMDISADVAMQRGDWGQEIHDKKDFQEKVADAFKLLQTSSWIRIDATQSKDEIEDYIKKFADEIVTWRKSDFKPLETLW